ncbi:hypothetical protein VU07_01700 [Desulfobulbus sp. F4]|nr:hypothetical protein [Desulfobulbus sp. F4]
MPDIRVEPSAILVHRRGVKQGQKFYTQPLGDLFSWGLFRYGGLPARIYKEQPLLFRQSDAVKGKMTEEILRFSACCL